MVHMDEGIGPEESKKMERAKKIAAGCGATGGGIAMTHSILEDLVKKASALPVDRFNSQFVETYIGGHRVCLTIQHYGGGDGQQRKVNTRKLWVIDGQSVSASTAAEIIAEEA